MANGGARTSLCGVYIFKRSLTGYKVFLRFPGADWRIIRLGNSPEYEDLAMLRGAKVKTRRLSFMLVLVTAMLLSLTGCQGLQPIALSTDVSSAEPSAVPNEPGPSLEASGSPVVGDADLGAIAALEGTLEASYAQVNPSVVNIRVVVKSEAPSAFSMLPDLPFFNQPSPQEPKEFYNQGLGSGFVWDEQGHIVTNNHVIDGADKIEVTFYDGTVREATFVGSDPDSDLAVLKVDLPAEDLHPVVFADSTQINVGELAIAIGNPFGLQGTMTVGIVSAIGRSLPVDSDLVEGSSYTIPDLIQTDAPINPGNSGGVLVDELGRVIGVTFAIASPVRGSAGIGFAIPSAIVQKVVPDLISLGHFDHPWLGISGTSLTRDLAEAMGLDQDQHGAMVVDVIAASPADKAGLQGSDGSTEIDGQSVRVGGDVITAIDGQAIRTFDDLAAYLMAHTEVEQKVQLSILRDGEEKQIEVTLAARPTDEPEIRQAEAESPAWLGIRGMNMSSEIAEVMGLAQDQTGVLVVSVVAGGPADEAGLRGSDTSITINGQSILIGGDIIIGFDDEPVDAFQDLEKLLRQADPGQEVVLEILRDGEQMQLGVILGAQPD